MVIYVVFISSKYIFNIHFHWGTMRKNLKYDYFQIDLNELSVTSVNS